MSGLGCQEGRGFNLVMDLPVPVGGSITGIIVRYVASVQSPRMTFRIAAIDENDLTPFDFTQILSFDSSVPSRGGFRNDSRVGFSAAPVSLTRRYLLFVDAPAPDYFTFCGATVLYSMP